MTAETNNDMQKSITKKVKVGRVSNNQGASISVCVGGELEVTGDLSNAGDIFIEGGDVKGNVVNQGKAPHIYLKNGMIKQITNESTEGNINIRKDGHVEKITIKGGGYIWIEEGADTGEGLFGSAPSEGFKESLDVIFGEWLDDSFWATKVNWRVSWNSESDSWGVIRSVNDVQEDLDPPADYADAINKVAINLKEEIEKS